MGDVEVADGAFERVRGLEERFAVAGGDGVVERGQQARGLRGEGVADAGQEADVAADGVEDCVRGTGGNRRRHRGAGDFADDRAERRLRGRLGQHRVEAGGDAAIAVFARRVRGDGDDRRARAALHPAETARHFEAVQSRHLHVEQDDVERALGEHVERLGAALHRRHDVPEPPHGLGGELLIDDVVIDDEHAQRTRDLGTALQRVRHRPLGRRRGPRRSRRATRARRRDASPARRRDTRARAAR